MGPFFPECGPALPPLNSRKNGPLCFVEVPTAAIGICNQLSRSGLRRDISIVPGHQEANSGSEHQDGRAPSEQVDTRTIDTIPHDAAVV